MNMAACSYPFTDLMQVGLVDHTNLEQFMKGNSDKCNSSLVKLNMAQI
jgi:hypothetical protein